MPISLESAQASELAELYGSEALELDGYSYVLYEESDEINDHKHVHWDRIYRRNDDKYFVQYCSKSGSYWSDYEFEYGDELYEVKQIKVIKLEWKKVRDEF